jgi:hypothetical protein
MAARGATTRRPFDERAALCDNTAVRPLPALIAAIAVFGACETPPDEPRMRDEALALAARYDERLDELEHRAEAVEQRRAPLPHDSLASASADHDLGQAHSVIEDQRGYLKTVRTRLQRPSTRAELRRLLDEMRSRLEDGITEVIADLSAVESWVAIATRAGAPGAQPAPPPPEPVDDRAPETDRSGAPIR